MTKLAAGVTAGYKTIGAAATLSVTAADAAASAALSFDGVSDEITSVTVGGAALNTVTLSGSLTDTSEDKINTIALNVNAGATQTGLTLNTAFNSNVTLTGAALATVNAAGSTGGVNVGAGGRAEVQTVAIPALAIADTFDLVAGTVTLSSSLAAASADELLADLQADADYATAPFTVALNAGKTALVLTWKNAGDVASLATLTKDPSGTPSTTTAVETVKGSAGLSTIHTITTGTGDDTVSNAFATTATQGASVTTGEGKDTIVIMTTGTGTTTVDAGAGNDTITLVKSAGNKLNVTGGAGDDVVNLSGVLATSDVVDGGDGIDTIAVAGSTTARTDDDFIVLNSLLKNFETLKLTSAEGTTLATGLNLDKLGANYTTVEFAASSFADNVGAQKLIANGALTAEAKGYVADDAGTAGVDEQVYAGSLNITSKGTATVTATAETVALTVDASKADVTTTLAGFAKTATVTLVTATDDKGTVATTDDDLFSAAFSLTNHASNANNDLTSLTITGNGTATVMNVDTTKLVTIDASALNSVDIKGKAAAGLDYTSTNTLAETIKLGAGLDVVKLNASTYGAVNAKTFDTVEGLNLVLDSTGTALDATKSDDIAVGSLTGFKKFTTTQTDLDLALKDAAVSTTGDNLVFQLGGNTYIYSDTGANGTVDGNDVLVKLVGTVDLDALIVALG